MEVSLFSSSLEPYQGSIENEQLKDSISHLAEANGGALAILSWDKSRIAVPLTLSVDIPPLGTYQNIDIRSVEPVLLVFNLIHYPSTAPLVFTDRLDFPKDKLAHLYVATNGKPPAFCYVRGSRDEWYANKRIQDIPIRISNWLRDAAAGELTQDGNQFEPLRLEGYVGVIIYDYDVVAKIVNDDKTLFPNEHYAIGLFETSPNGGFRLVKIITLENVKEIADELKKDKAKSDTDPNRKRYRFGYFLWSEEPYVFDHYNISFPETWGEFKDFCSQHKIDSGKFEDFYATFDDSNYVVFPAAIAVKRPKQIIGFSSNIEFVNFRFSIDTGDVVNGKILDTVKVELTSHNQPLTTSKARIISGISEDNKFSATVFGCGALGSKITMHLARSGMTNLMLIDPDDLSPHNMVRHALLPDYEGQNKAAALADVITRLFPTEEIQVAHLPLPNLPFALGSNFFDKADWVFDFTASNSFFAKLVLTDVLNNTRVISAHISDFGNIGIFFREGINRNPRIDDLKIDLYSQYNSEPEIKAWLKREKDIVTNTNFTVSVGVGCNSETTILSDDKVSLHAAIFSSAIKKEVSYQTSENGRVLLSRMDTEDNFDLKTIQLDVKPLEVLLAKNDSSWTVRFKYGIISRIQKEMRQAGRQETGGVFTGVANHKTKTIHVTGLIPAPPDSRATSVCFFRGHQGLPDQVGVVTEGSGGQLGYIGEWHSHPDGPNGLSTIDLASVQKFKKEFDTLLTPLPVFLTIVTPEAVLPYVF
jgi:hypothetical protein